MIRLFVHALLFAVLTGCATAPVETAKRFDSERIDVTVSGEGSDVVLLAGAGADANAIWRGTIERMPGHRYHVVQVAGFAGTPLRGNAGDGPVVEPIAAEVARYVREAGLEQPRLIGLSMGGTIAMRVGARHPDLVSGVMVLDMVPFMGAFFGPQIKTASDAKEVAAKRHAAMLAETPEQRRAQNEKLVAGMVRTESLRADVAAAGLASDAKLMAHVMRDMITLDLRDELAAIPSPFVVLYVHAPLIPLTAEQTDGVYRHLFASAPQAELERIPDAYHFIMLDQPERFAEELRQFLP